MRRLAIIVFLASSACAAVRQALPRVPLAPPAAEVAVPTGGGRIDGAIVRAELRSLLGKSPDDARRALRGYGHDGKVTVAPGRQFVEGCERDRVCGFDVPESGMGVHDPITLFVNPGLTIAAPPPG